jgi:integrase
VARKPREEPRPRRKKGTGAVYQRKSDDRWAYEWYVEDERYIGYADTYEQANNAVLREIAKVEQGTFIAPDKITVSQWLDEWWTNTKSADHRPGPRYRRGQTIESRLKPEIGTTRIQELTSRRLQKLVAEWIKEGLKPRTIRGYFGLLSQAIDAAVKHGIVKENPCKAVDLPRLSKTKKPALKLDQVQLLIAQARDHWLEPWIAIAAGTGMRLGELSALKWEDIDFEAEIIHVMRSVTHLPGQYEVGEPKTEAGVRDIVIPDFVMEELLSLQKEHLRKKGEHGLGWNNLGLVLPHDRNGGYRNPDVVNQAFRRMLERAGLPSMSFHSLRHSAVRIRQALKVPLEVIQKMVGHGSIKVTADTYGDVDIDMQIDATERVNDAWRKGAN